MADIKFEIKKELGTISSSAKGWNKEVNLVSWNGAAPKYDIRDWSPEHEKMGKGITLTEEEARHHQKLVKRSFYVKYAMGMKAAFWQMYIIICDRFVRKEEA